MGLCETRKIIVQYISVHGSLPIASPAEHRHQEVDEKMWKKLKDLDGIRLRKRKRRRSREEKTLISFKELDGVVVIFMVEFKNALNRKSRFLKHFIPH